MNIIVDAMGGDNAPLEIVKGAILVGDEKKINSCVKENNITLKNTQIKHCTDEITMCDDAKSVLKKKPDSSLAIGFKLLNDGEGDAEDGVLACVGGAVGKGRLAANALLPRHLEHLAERQSD